VGESQDLSDNGLLQMSNMKVLFLAAEATPFVKVGGLADVAGELPPVLRSMGADVRVVLPFYDMLHEDKLSVEHCKDIKLTHAHGQKTGSLYLAKKGKERIYLLDGDPIRRAHKVYGDNNLDAQKFTFAFLAAMEAMQALDWQPDILHAHDWHASPAIVRLSALREKDPFWRSVASLLTVHNLPYMGSGGEMAMELYGIPPSVHPKLPYWARHLPLPMGLAAADWITTVSPTYAREIQSVEFAHGLEEVLQSRAGNLLGILNGIDVHHWDPATDPSVPVNYSRQTLPARRQVKRMLQEQFGFRLEEHIPLICMITRLDYQKGIDIALAAMEGLVDHPWQFVLQGTGNQELENRARSFAEINKDKVRVIIRFDTDLARKIYAGADIILIPSRYEPCGLTQIIAMRYGCIPVVSATGGLKDTVIDYYAGEPSTGFVFSPNEPQYLSQAIQNAESVYSDQRRWRALQLRGMAKDFSWERSARKYLDLYRKASEERKNLR
jgi:starch synthase